MDFHLLLLLMMMMIFVDMVQKEKIGENSN